MLVYGLRIGLTALVIDEIASGWSTGLNQLAFGSDESRASLARYLAGYATIAPALIVTVSSLAITTVTTFGNPALMLLLRRAPTGNASFLSPLVGRTNPFLTPLTLAVGLIIALQLVVGGYSVGLTGVKPPTLVLVFVIIALLILTSFKLVFWLVALRRPAAVVAQTAGIARETLASMSRSSRLHSHRESGVASPFTTHYEEQELLKLSVYSLTEAAIRSIEARQRFAARESVEALRKLRSELGQRELPNDWAYLWRTTPDHRVAPHARCRSAAAHIRRRYWFHELLVESFESVLLVSAELHYASVASDVSDNLLQLGTWLVTQVDRPQIRTRSPRDRQEADAVLDRVFQAFEYAADECIQFGDPNVFEIVVADFLSLARRLPLMPQQCPSTASRLTGHLRNAADQAMSLKRPEMLDRYLEELTVPLLKRRDRTAGRRSRSVPAPWTQLAVTEAAGSLVTHTTRISNYPAVAGPASSTTP